METGNQQCEKRGQSSTIRRSSISIGCVEFNRIKLGNTYKLCTFQMSTEALLRKGHKLGTFHKVMKFSF